MDFLWSFQKELTQQHSNFSLGDRFWTSNLRTNKTIHFYQCETYICYCRNRKQTLGLSVLTHPWMQFGTCTQLLISLEICKGHQGPPQLPYSLGTLAYFCISCISCQCLLEQPGSNSRLAVIFIFPILLPPQYGIFDDSWNFLMILEIFQILHQSKFPLKATKLLGYQTCPSLVKYTANGTASDSSHVIDLFF